jgi:hypothetical protein
VRERQRHDLFLARLEPRLERLQRGHILGRRRSKGDCAEKEFTKPLLVDSEPRHFQAYWNGRPD